MPLVARPDLRGLASDDWDDRIADLQYRDTGEYAVVTMSRPKPSRRMATAGGAHLLGADRRGGSGSPRRDRRVELKMDALAALADFADAQAKLNPLVTEYRAGSPSKRCLRYRRSAKRPPRVCRARHRVAADRIAQGIALLEDPQCLAAFQAREQSDGGGRPAPPGRHARQRRQTRSRPEWRPFQLAFLLMNLRGHRRPDARRPRGGGPALLPHRRRQDRGLPGPGGLHAGPAAAARTPAITLGRA